MTGPMLPIQTIPPELPDAACRGEDTALFYPTRVTDETVPVGKRICQRCAHVVECLEYALKHESHGTWGATSEWDRIALRVRAETGVGA